MTKRVGVYAEGTLPANLTNRSRAEVAVGTSYVTPGLNGRGQWDWYIVNVTPVTWLGDRPSIPDTYTNQEIQEYGTTGV